MRTIKEQIELEKFKHNIYIDQKNIEKDIKLEIIERSHELKMERLKFKAEHNLQCGSPNE